mgnify:FL=1
MELVCTYIESENFEKSVEFYKKVLQIEPNEFCTNRWVEFECGNKLSIYNRKYDEGKINNINYNEAYIKDFNKLKSEKKNNIVTFNFYTDNLKEEYTRIQNLNLGQVSEIMYVNIVEPYFYFNISDPDGNILEICSGNYE